MKRLAVAAAVLMAGLSAATPAIAGHDVHWRRHDVARHGQVTIGVGGHYVYATPGFSFGFGVGYPGPYVYGYAPAPVYVAPLPVYLGPAPVYYGLPVVVAPHSCSARLRAHYVWRDGRYYHHKGHQGHHRHGRH